VFLIPVLVLLLSSISAVACSTNGINTTITIPAVTVANPSQDYISIICQGNAQIQLTVLSSDPGLVLNSQNVIGNSSFATGQLQFENVTPSAGIYNASLEFTSSATFTINLTAVTLSSNTTLGSLSVPANTTTQINFQLIYNVNPTPPPSVATDYLPGFPIWVILIYVIMIPLFLAPAIMDRRGLKSVRKGWKMQDSLALYFRYLSYGIWIILPVMTAGILAQVMIINIFSLKQAIAVGDWLLSFILAILFGIAYRVGKWRGIFDNIDEEE